MSDNARETKEIRVCTTNVRMYSLADSRFNSSSHCISLFRLPLSFPPCRRTCIVRLLVRALPVARRYAGKDSDRLETFYNRRHVKPHRRRHRMSLLSAFRGHLDGEFTRDGSRRPRGSLTSVLQRSCGAIRCSLLRESCAVVRAT